MLSVIEKKNKVHFDTYKKKQNDSLDKIKYLLSTKYKTDSVSVLEQGPSATLLC